MAAPSAYEQPTLNRAWEALLAHIPTFVVIWLVVGGLAIVSFLVWLLVFVLLVGGVAPDVFGVVVAAFIGAIASSPFALLLALVSFLFSAVPVLYYERGEVVTVGAAFAELMRRPLRYVLAGVLYGVLVSVGSIFGVLPGIAVSLVAPVYINRVVASDQSITDALAGSFRAVYASPHAMSFVGIQLLAGLVASLVSSCTCLVGLLVAVPMLAFYIQNVAYNKGVIT